MKAMRITTRLAAALSLLLLLTPIPPLAAQPDEDEYAETPTDLAELLGHQDNSGVTYVAYLSHEDPARKDRHLLLEKVEHREHLITFSQAMLVIDANDEARGVYYRRTYYSRSGDFVRRDVRTVGREQSETSLLLPDDGVFLLTRTFTSNLAPHNTISDQEELPPIHESAIPEDWLPLAYAYHLRHQHQSFAIRTHDYGDSDYLTLHIVEDVGTETVLVAGEQKVAHVFMVRITLESMQHDGHKPDGWEDILLQEYVLEDGTTVQTRRESGDVTLEYLPASPEDIESLLDRLPTLEEFER
jgi:hypothetical protein